MTAVWANRIKLIIVDSHIGDILEPQPVLL